MKSRTYEARGIDRKRHEAGESGYKSGYTLRLPVYRLPDLRRLRFGRGIWR